MIQQNSIFTSCTDLSSCAGTQAVHLPAFYLFLPLQGVRPEDGKIGTHDQGGQRHAWEYGTLGIVGLQAYQPVSFLTFKSIPLIDALFGFSTHSCGFLRPNASTTRFVIHGFPAVDLLRVTNKDRITCVSDIQFRFANNQFCSIPVMPAERSVANLKQVGMIMRRQDAFYPLAIFS